MNQQEAIAALEPEWNRPDGFFAKLRGGTFNPAHAKRIVAIVGSLNLEDENKVSRRLVSLLWYLPLFCGWQTERVEGAGGELGTYERFVTALTNELEEQLGIP